MPESLPEPCYRILEWLKSRRGVELTRYEKTSAVINGGIVRGERVVRNEQAGWLYMLIKKDDYEKRDCIRTLDEARCIQVCHYNGATHIETRCPGEAGSFTSSRFDPQFFPGNTGWHSPTSDPKRIPSSDPKLTGWDALFDRIDWVAIQITKRGLEVLAAHPVDEKPAALQNQTGEPGPLLSEDSYLSPNSLANHFGVDANAPRARLDRWRIKNHTGWIENTERARGERKHLYCVGAVRHIIQEMRATTEARSERAARKT